MLRHLFVAVVAFAGDFSYWRIWRCIVAAAGTVVAVYLMALPTELPAWPALLAAGVGAMVGIMWECRANEG
jgi:hypothetical protein